MLVDVWQLESTDVDQQEKEDCDDGKRHSERVLSSYLAVRGFAFVVEDQEKDDEDRLVDQLAPSLHSECQKDASTTVKLIVSACTFAVYTLHRRNTCHGIFTANSDTEDE